MEEEGDKGGRKEEEEIRVAVSESGGDLTEIESGNQTKKRDIRADEELVILIGGSQTSEKIETPSTQQD